MAFLDRLRGKPKPTAPPKPKGGTGRQNTDGFIEYDELNASLQGRQGYRVFEKMWRTDADTRRALAMIAATFAGGTIVVEPFHDEDDEPTDQDRQVARFVEWNLLKYMRPALPGHVWMATTMAGRFGSTPFEQIYDLAEWEGRRVFALKTLDPRRPASVDEWHQDGPDLTRIVQYVPGGDSTENATIPAEDLVLYRFGAEGDNWEGQSLLRPAYKHWLFKEGLEIVAAQALEMSSMGVPTGYAPQGAGDDFRDEFEDFLANVGKDRSYILFPGPKQDQAKDAEGYFWEFVTPDNAKQAADALVEVLNYHSDKIAASVMEEFMRQGIGTVGTNATAETQQDPFLTFCEAMCSIVIEASINEQLVPRLVGLNFETDRMPCVSFSLIDSTSLTELADYVQKLANAGALRPESTLEGYLRDKADLPPADEQEIRAKEQQEADQAQANAEAQRAHDLALAERKTPTPSLSPATPSVKKLEGELEGETYWLSAGPGEPRALKPHEQHMSLERLEGALDGARAHLAIEAGPAARAMAAEMARTAATGARLQHKPPPTDLVDAIETSLQHLYAEGRISVREELAAQGAPVDVTALAVDPTDKARQLAERAHAIADAIRTAIIGGLRRALLRNSDPASLQIAAEQAANAAIRQQAQDHASAVVNAGRSDQADELSDLIAGSRYTSILDANRCQDCARADDDVLRPLTDPVRLARKPPNPECDGFPKCRCMEAYELRAEAAPAI